MVDLPRFNRSDDALPGLIGHAHYTPAARAALEHALPLARGEHLTELLRQLTLCCDVLADPAGAIEFARRTLMRAAGDHTSLHALTLNLFRQHSDVRAWQWLSELRRHHPDELGIYWDLLRLFQIQDRAADAVTLARELEVAHPEDPEVAGMAAAVYHAVGSSDEAWASAERALDRDPDAQIAHEAMAAVLLSQGRFKEGFQHVLRLDELVSCERAALLARNDTAPSPSTTTACGRPWRGESLVGERLLVIADTSLGRNLQLSRYLQWATSRAEEVGFTGPDTLRKLFTQLPRVQWLDDSDTIEAMQASCYCSLTTLAAHYHQLQHEIPILDAPYAQVPSTSSTSTSESWRARGDGEGLRVGICWSAGAAGGLDVSGSQCDIAFERLRPLLAREGIHFYALPGDVGTQHAECGAHPRCGDHRDELKDLNDVAEFMQSLDLVISVDSAAAHLAGNLELPVWVLLANRPDPLWAQDGGHCSWYPTARIFRQRQHGDWDRVIRQVGSELDALLPTRA